MEMRATTLTSPRHYASISFSPLPSVSPSQLPSHGSFSVKPLSSSYSHWRATPIIARRSPVLVRFSALNTPAEPQSEVTMKAADLVDELKGTSLFLVGMKCAMKTLIGRRLAGALRYYFFDSDNLVEEAFGGETAAKLALQSDEQGFKEAETEVLKQLSAMGRLVVCAGDCAVQSSTNLFAQPISGENYVPILAFRLPDPTKKALLRDGISIWVEIPLDVLEKQSRQTITNPDLFSEVLAALSVRYDEFRDGYGTADATVSLQRVAVQQGYKYLDSVTIDEMTIETLKQVEKLIKVKKMMQAAAKPF